jgi:Leucine rich repeat
MIFTVIFASIYKVKSTEVACESVKVSTHFDKTRKYCLMDETTVIVLQNVKISTHDSLVETLKFIGNRNISYLPVNVDKSFPNLIFFGASHCSVLEVSANNFKGLNKLNDLWLDHNQIETIANGTFEGLKDLKHLFLGKIILLFYRTRHL